MTRAQRRKLKMIEQKVMGAILIGIGFIPYFIEVNFGKWFHIFLVYAYSRDSRTSRRCR